MSERFLSQHTFVLVRPAESTRSVYSLAAASHLSGVHPDLLRHYCQIGLLGEERASTEAEPVFDDDALYEVRRIEHFRRYHGVNLRALPLLCTMSREIEQLRAEVRFLRER